MVQYYTSITYNIIEMERLSGWPPWYSVEILQTSFNIPSEYKGCRPDNLSISLIAVTNGRIDPISNSLKNNISPSWHKFWSYYCESLAKEYLGQKGDWTVICRKLKSKCQNVLEKYAIVTGWWLGWPMLSMLALCCRHYNIENLPESQLPTQLLQNHFCPWHFGQSAYCFGILYRAWQWYCHALSVQNFKTIRHLKWMLWRNEIWQDLRFRFDARIGKIS